MLQSCCSSSVISTGYRAGGEITHIFWPDSELQSASHADLCLQEQFWYLCGFWEFINQQLLVCADLRHFVAYFQIYIFSFGLGRSCSLFQGALKFSSDSSGSSRLFQRVSWPGELYRNIYVSLPSTYAEILLCMCFYLCWNLLSGDSTVALVISFS